MFDILNTSAMDLATMFLNKANGNVRITSPFEPAPSMMLSKAKNQEMPGLMSFTTRFHESRKLPKLSNNTAKYFVRKDMATKLKEVKPVFEKGTAIEVPSGPFGIALKAITEVASLARQNNEDYRLIRNIFLDAWKEVIPDGFVFEDFMKDVNPKRTQPWNAYDKSYTRHINGMENMSQGVQIDLGNYSNDSNTAGRLVDWNKVALLLRSIGCLTCGCEPWLRKYTMSYPLTIKYALVLEEFPKKEEIVYINKGTLDLMKAVVKPIAGTIGYMKTQLAEWMKFQKKGRILTQQSSKLIESPDFRLAVSEALLERKEPIMFFSNPMTKSKLSFEDDLLEFKTGRSYEMDLKQVDKEVKLSTLSGVFHAFMPPYLNHASKKDTWVERTNALVELGDFRDAALVVSENLDKKFIRLCFSVLRKHSNNETSAWKSFLRYFYKRSEPIPEFASHDVASVFFASLRHKPREFGTAFNSWYWASRYMTSKLNKSDLLRPKDFTVAYDLKYIRRKMFTRIAKSYTNRYRAQASVLLKKLKGEKEMVKDIKKFEKWKQRLLELQWKIKHYPKFDCDPDIESYWSHKPLMESICDTIRNYARKRNKGITPKGDTIMKLLLNFEQDSGEKVRNLFAIVQSTADETWKDVDQVFANAEFRVSYEELENDFVLDEWEEFEMRPVIVIEKEKKPVSIIKETDSPWGFNFNDIMFSINSAPKAVYSKMNIVVEFDSNDYPLTQIPIALAAQGIEWDKNEHQENQIVLNALNWMKLNYVRKLRELNEEDIAILDSLNNDIL
jgi:hypothetical protein